MNTKDIVIRDPFILADEGKYYLYGTRSETAWGHGDGFDVYESSDLEEWTGPAEIFRRPADFWADKEFWAPECIRKGDKYYLIATFGTEGKPKGIQILESDTPAGPFALLTECPITPKDWNCLDGTVYTDASGTSWLVFSHSFPQEPGGAITAARLSDDMTRRMLWSSWSERGYAMGISVSEDGITGPWIHGEKAAYYGGGHGMVFNGNSGESYVLWHAPNEALHEHPRLMPLDQFAGGADQA